MKNYAVLEKDKKLINNHIAVVLKEAFNKGYAQGYGDCKVELTTEESNVFYKEGYDQGLRHGEELKVKAVNCAEICGMQRAWNVARKIISRHGEGYDATDVEVFGTDDVFGLSAYEAIEKLETWEKKQRKIK